MPIRLRLSILLPCLLTACAAHAPAHPVVRRPSADLVVVGRIELVPALTPSERRLWGHDPRLANQVDAVFSDHRIDLTALSKEARADGKPVGLGDDFMLRMPRTRRLYYLGGVVWIGTEPAPGYNGRPVTFDDRELRLPGGFAVPVRGDDRAIYIGTIRYVRDGFGVVRAPQFIDDYASMRAAYLRDYGANPPPLRDVVPTLAR